MQMSTFNCHVCRNDRICRVQDSLRYHIEQSGVKKIHELICFLSLNRKERIVLIIVPKLVGNVFKMRCLYSHTLLTLDPRITACSKRNLTWSCQEQQTLKLPQSGSCLLRGIYVIFPRVWVSCLLWAHPIYRPGLFVFTQMLMWSIFFLSYLKNNGRSLENAYVKIWRYLILRWVHLETDPEVRICVIISLFRRKWDKKMWGREGKETNKV